MFARVCAQEVWQANLVTDDVQRAVINFPTTRFYTYVSGRWGQVPKWA